MPTLIVLLVIISLVTIFSVQNAAPVTISLFFWSFQGSLAVVIFLSTVVGIIIGVIIMSMMHMRSVRKKKEKESQAIQDL
ncbi:MAG: hypothetical protein A2X56_09100 [Nitrospirae bacterium GWC2_57_13]|jgi:uncharacterized integral membrane protein|nr:MAG: hypothetical protein A2072_06795 [Nitrospirae bacterium GWC1_57_7]OGW26895.1 MAG: hypothetical protein A2X56_09100 [Nitrospirae bacterium GWC2_57_13]OGW41375.1 MAG: hypothetical protein A2X57_09425 [Nitrospirae bacterium GWD2_57_8]HAR46481.1 hypothetical protein [Nitrospiraceae bacterium]